jgi:hypothetical protein
LNHILIDDFSEVALGIHIDLLLANECQNFFALMKPTNKSIVFLSLLKALLTFWNVHKYLSLSIQIKKYKIASMSKSIS